MDVFALRDRLVEDYASYARSFIADPRIRRKVGTALDAGAFWFLSGRRRGDPRLRNAAGRRYGEARWRSRSPAQGARGTRGSLDALRPPNLETSRGRAGPDAPQRGVEPAGESRSAGRRPRIGPAMSAACGAQGLPYEPDAGPKTL